MDYERIHKVESGIISPSKLRMKLLMGAHQYHHQRIRKDGRSNSTSNSSRTSPSKLQQDSEFFKDSLLQLHFQSENHDGEVPSLQPPSVKPCCDGLQSVVASSSSAHGKVQHSQQGGAGGEFIPWTWSTALHSSVNAQSKSQEDDENLDYDSNASSSSFEFHKGDTDRGINNNINRSSLMRSFSRPTSYKWYEADKWIMNKQQTTVQANSHPKGHGQLNSRFSMVRVTPETTAGYDHRLQAADTRRFDFCQTTQTPTQMGMGMGMGIDKFSFAHPVADQPISSQSNVANPPIDLYPESCKDLKEIDPMDDSAGTPAAAIRAVCMRDMGTEMTPVTSQEPSRTATPVGATTPLRSPSSSSIPSTPRRSGTEQISNQTEYCAINFDSHINPTDNSCKKELSEQELKLKTRREIVALGVQLGKLSIAAWASEDHENEMSNASAAETIDHSKDLERIEEIFQKRAAAWEEAEKSKHNARFKREEIKIQAWESQKKAKLESQLKRIEAKIEQIRASGEAKMVKKIEIARKKSEEKRAAAEARKKRQAEKTAAQLHKLVEASKAMHAKRVSG